MSSPTLALPDRAPTSDPLNPYPTYIWPVKGRLTSQYGLRWGRMHQGIDIAGKLGTPIVAAAPGLVVFSGWHARGYGNLIAIRHLDGSITRYAHNQRNLVQVGEAVRQGQVIAEMGSTGNSTGAHVYFEIHSPEQQAIDPLVYLAQPDYSALEGV